MLHNQPHQPQHCDLNEGLEIGDLSRLVNSRVSVDEYKSKIGKDEEIVVLAVRVQGKSPALDLVNFVEKSYEWIIDADASSGELNDGNYLVFIELDRDDNVPDYLVQLFEDLVNLTGIPLDEWILSVSKPHATAKVDRDKIAKLIPLSAEAYLARQRSRTNEIDSLKTAAGVRVESRAPINDFTESLRIAAGIR